MGGALNVNKLLWPSQRIPENGMEIEGKLYSEIQLGKSECQSHDLIIRAIL